MTTKTKLITGALVVLIAYAFGYYEAPYKTITVTKIVEVEKKQEQKTTDAQKHKKTTIVEKDSPDGTKEITTTITDDVDKKTDSTKTDDIAKSSDTTKEVIKSSGKLNLYGLAGLNTSELSAPIYGGMVSKEILGPISVGAWGLTNRTIGISLGVGL